LPPEPLLRPSAVLEMWRTPTRLGSAMICHCRWASISPAPRQSLPRHSCSWRASRVGAPGDVNRLSRPRLRGAIPVLALLPLRAFGVCGLALIVAAGFFGNQNPFKNFAPTAVWVVWWVGTAYLSAFIGNVWPLLNPWTAAVDALRALKRHRVEPRPGLLRYPQWLGIWPAVALFLLFAWAELVWEGRDVPHNVAAGAALYSILTWLGFWVFGRDAWLRGGEAFSVFFAMLGRFAPLRLERADGRWLWTLRPYAVGLLTLRPLHVSEMVFVLTMLATVTTDGFLETPLWANAVEYLLRPENRAEIPEHQGYFRNRYRGGMRRTGAV
jgi:hypothetical protein